ncbi:MAG: MBL fold metallo-hydrolase [Candidatus Abyssobacteria bacterium SURF_17]|jgi:ribonuclease BN (tRNA processing enzyme)|uniref:MBL fold metallo-hydrolase n=1 Tax=Candidatus Abyssobacteria bacterium SURF_17 TaxID=2093361 RepID=A0A419ETU3_9BACT|nr:MAG: MBL fold metallo-hydrolase [Candidatus Abyssubacteria bacterium SURF_17]
MQIRFVGCGDAFASGGRFNTCFHVTGEKANFLIDCGASSLIALKNNRIEMNTIDTILVTHFHADHFGGIPFFLLDAQFFSRRTQRLTIVGPEGLRESLGRVMEASFPGSVNTIQRFEVSTVELRPHEPAALGELRVTAFPVSHGGERDRAFAYRIETEGRTIAYTGDTGWTDELIEAGHAADLLIAEAYFYNKHITFHLDLATLMEHLPSIVPKRLVLTHMSDDMLSRLPDIPYEVAEDGKMIEV